MLKKSGKYLKNEFKSKKCQFASEAGIPSAIMTMFKIPTFEKVVWRDKYDKMIQDAKTSRRWMVVNGKDGGSKKGRTIRYLRDNGDNGTNKSVEIRSKNVKLLKH